MKRFIFTAILIGLVGWGIISLRDSTRVAPVAPLPSLPALPSKPILGLVKNEDTLAPFEVLSTSYRMAWHFIDPKADVSMGINDALALSSEEIFSSKQCKIMTSGGFYSPDGKPIGLLIVDGRELSAWQKNSLFVGVLGSDDGQFVIVLGDVRNRSFDWAVQAGPVVWYQKEAMPLSLKNDQQARRILAGITTDGRLVLMVVVAKDSLFGGPFLTDLRMMLPVMSSLMNVEFEAVINLDGGTASAFVSETLSVKELKPIGSWICVK